jgi:endoglycosylceramidase
VILRGFDESFLMEDRSHPPTPFDERDVELMQQAGMSVVRLAIDWYHIEPVRGHIDQAYLDRVRQVADLFNRHGMYVVLDMHFLLNWSARFGGAGAPNWAAIPGVPDIQIGPSAVRADYSPAVVAAESYFWLSPDWQRDFYLAWQAVAEYFRADSGLAGYDIYNEPHPFPLPPNLFETSWMWPLYQHSIEAIGKVDPNHLFFAEGTLFLGWPVAIDKLQAPNLVYSPHFYDGSIVPPNYTGDNRQIIDGVKQNVAEADRLGSVPMWVGEMGIDHRQALATQWTDELLNLYDQLGVGWGWWQWRQDDGWGIRDRDGDRLDLAFLSHLARPYLFAAPTGVTSSGADGVHGRLLIHVAAGHAAGPVSVGWSSLTLAAPQVKGSCVAASQWDAGAGRLMLQVQSKAACDVSLQAS